MISLRINDLSLYFSNFELCLLISTLEYYFKGIRELFQGLAIDRLEKEWNCHPVHDGCHIYMIGVSFPIETRRIDGWKIAE